jgi:hypothetical protein
VAEQESPPPQYEWEFLTYDIDAVCAECGQPVRAGQAVGHAGTTIIHAKCYKDASTA